MDWSQSEMQDAVKELAGTILADGGDPWPALMDSGLLELEDFNEVVTLLIEIGRAASRAPVLETLVLGWPATGRGSVRTAALAEAGCFDLRTPATTARGGRLTGQKINVPAADRADHVVVTAQDGVYLVHPGDCSLTAQTATDDATLFIVGMDGTPGERLGGLELLDAWLPRIQVGMAAVQLGLSQHALDLTAKYVAERQQFGKPIATFQAVGQRIADMWIDAQAMDVTLKQAAWRLSEGLPATREVLIAAYWAAEGAHRILAGAQHLHGGMGFDRDYPLHRYFLMGKRLEFTLGGGAERLEELGDLLAG